MSMLEIQLSSSTTHRDQLAAFARYFDHTDLKPTSNKELIERLCAEAADYNFATVCIAPRWVETAANFLSRRGTNSVGVCTVVGFPHGNITTEGKVFEVTHAISLGASEIDMVVAVGDLIDNNQPYVEYDIGAVVEAAHAKRAIVKVILETAYLDEGKVILGCQLAVRARADFVKTSTGFGPSGADVEVVRLMRKTVGSALGVKAAGGIRCLADAQNMINAGASRIGCSSSAKIISEMKSEFREE